MIVWSFRLPYPLTHHHSGVLEHGLASVSWFPSPDLNALSWIINKKIMCDEERDFLPVAWYNIFPFWITHDHTYRERRRECWDELYYMMVCLLQRQSVGYICLSHARYAVRIMLRAPYLENAFPPGLSLSLLLFFPYFSSSVSHFRVKLHFSNYLMFLPIASDPHRRFGDTSTDFITTGRARASIRVRVSEELQAPPILISRETKSAPRWKF